MIWYRKIATIIVEVLTSWSPGGQSTPVQGNLYLLLPLLVSTVCKFSVDLIKANDLTLRLKKLNVFCPVHYYTSMNKTPTKCTLMLVNRCVKYMYLYRGSFNQPFSYSSDTGNCAPVILGHSLTANVKLSNRAWPHGLQEAYAWQSEIVITCSVKGPQFSW
jgi:hypothetical protein